MDDGARIGTEWRGRVTRGAATAVVAVVMMLIAACGGPWAPPPPPVVLAASVTPGQENVAPSEPVVVSAANGRLTEVTVTPTGGAPLAGELDAAETRWRSAPLEFGTEYRVHAVGVDPFGTPGTALDQTFRTAAPSETLDIEAMRPSDGQTVGVAMPVSITFGREVTDRAAVERRVSVATSTPVEGSFHWMSDSQLNWRPKDFWTPGTKVTVTANLRGVDVGGGIFGSADTTRGFTIGRDQRAFGDVNSHELTVFQDGKEIRSLPASYGRDVYPTQSGVHVAFEKHEQKRMTSASWGGPALGAGGYDEVLPLAVRISNNGEFVHVNAATVGQQGESNVSHGCVNLSPADGRFFYNWIQMGDPVEIVGSDKPLTTADGDIADWTIPWDQYRQGSALLKP